MNIKKFLISAAVFVSCLTGNQAYAEQPNLIILFMPSSVSKDYLSPYNSDITITPNIQALADDSVVFRNHRSDSAVTASAYASVFSGLPAPEHGVLSYPESISENIYDLTEFYKDQGYTVIYFNGNTYADADLGYAQGADQSNRYVFMNHRTVEAITSAMRIAERNREEKIMFVFSTQLNRIPYIFYPVNLFCRMNISVCRERVKGERFVYHRSLFLDEWQNLKAVPDAALKRLGIKSDQEAVLADVIDLMYMSGIYHLDVAIETLVSAMKALGLYDDALLIFASPHGENLMDEYSKGQLGNQNSVNSRVLEVPLMIKLPGSVSKAAVTGQSTLADIYPTLLGLTGYTDVPDPLKGIDWSDHILNGADVSDRAVFSYGGSLDKELLESVDQDLKSDYLRKFPDSSMQYSSFAVKQGNLVMQYHPSEERQYRAYNLSDDPYELYDIFDEDDPAQINLKDRLTAYASDLISG